MEYAPTKEYIPTFEACAGCVATCAELKGEDECDQQFCLRGLRQAFRTGDYSVEMTHRLLSTFSMEDPQKRSNAVLFVVKRDVQE